MLAAYAVEKRADRRTARVEIPTRIAVSQTREVAKRSSPRPLRAEFARVRHAGSHGLGGLLCLPDDFGFFCSDPKFDFCSITPNATGVEVFRATSEKHRNTSALKAVHQFGAVIRSGEYRPRETVSGPPRAIAGAQPLPHNPRIQRKNPAAAGSGERFRVGQMAEGKGLRSNVLRHLRT